MFGKRGSIVPGKLLDSVTDHHQKLSEYSPAGEITQGDIPMLSWETLLLIAKKAMLSSGTFEYIEPVEVILSFSHLLVNNDWTRPINSMTSSHYYETYGCSEDINPIGKDVSKDILRMAEAFDPSDYPNLFTDEVLERARRELDMCSRIVQSFSELEDLVKHLEPYRGGLTSAINYIHSAEHVLDSDDTFI